MTTSKIFILLSLCCTTLYGMSQNNGGALSFLDITPDTRGLGMGNTGTAGNTTAFSVYRNAGKTLYSNHQGAIAYSYIPWMRDVISGGRLHSVAGYYKFQGNHSIVAGFRNFTHGSVDLYDAEGKPQGYFYPKDMSIELGYAISFIRNLAFSLTGRYIRTDMSAIDSNAKDDLFCVDFGAYYYVPLSSDKDSRLSFGFKASNLGSTVDYGYNEYELPSKVNFGTGITFAIGYNSYISSDIDVNYQFLPSDCKSLSGGIGLELCLREIVAFRGGYFLANKDKGDTSYATLGCGFSWWFLQGDFAYLFPSESDSVLKNQWQFSIGINFGNK